MEKSRYMNLDYSEDMEEILNAIGDVFGFDEKIRLEIFVREKNTLYLRYYLLDEIKEYYSFLVESKKKQLTGIFFEIIGKPFSVPNFADDFSEGIKKQITPYLDINLAFEKEHQKYKGAPEGILAFANYSFFYSQASIEDGQRKFINHITGKNIETLEEYQTFKETEECKHIFNKIEYYLEVYRHLVEEMQAFYKELTPMKEYIEKETARKDILHQQKRNELIDEIEAIVPESLKEKFAYCKPNLNGSLKNCSNIEYFSKEKEKKLENPRTKLSEKLEILYYRLCYFKQIGFDIETLDLQYDKLRKAYEEAIRIPEIRESIPSFSFAEEIAKRRKQKWEEVEKEFLCTSESFLENYSHFAQTEKIKEELYKDRKIGRICTNGMKGNGTFWRNIHYTIHSGGAGVLDYVFLHELIHAIEYVYFAWLDYCVTGFEKSYFGKDSKINPYDPDTRKYERMNETFVDILAIEVRDLLHQRGIYFAEPKEFCKQDASNYNTDSLLKEMVKPLLDHFREKIIASRFTGSRKHLRFSISKKDFEEINDIINEVDFLIRFKKLKRLLQEGIDDPTVTEYRSALERLEKIYKKILPKQKQKTYSYCN